MALRLASMVLCALSLASASNVQIIDLSDTVNTGNCALSGGALVPQIDTIKYARVGPDTSIAYVGTSGHQPAWQTVISPSTGRFIISYIVFKTRVGNTEGNYYMERRLQLFPETDSLALYDVYENVTSHDNATGTYLTKAIMLSTGAMQVIGGYSTESIIGQNNRVYRICQPSGGTTDSLAIIDTIAEFPLNTFYVRTDDSYTPALNKIYPGYCLNATGDTLYAAYTLSNSTNVKAAAIRLAGRNSSVRVRNTTVFAGDGTSLYDLGIARDPASGRFLITSLKGSTTLLACLTNPELTLLDTASLQTTINPFQLQARNIRVIALGNDHFAIAYWKGNNGASGVYMEIVDASSGDIQSVRVDTLEHGIGIIPSFSLCNGLLAVAWLKDPNAGTANTGQIYGRIYQIVAGMPGDCFYDGPLSSSSTITESYLSPPGNFRSSISLDSAGNLVTLYIKPDNKVYASAWSSIRYFVDSAYVELRPDSIDETGWGSLAADSIMYSNFRFASIGSGGSVSIGFRQGPASVLAGLFSTVDSNSVIGPVPGPYYQFSAILRGDSTLYPRVAAISFDFNVKPAGARIDSVALNSSAFGPAPDTVKVRSRMDTLRLFASARDYDNASAATLYFTGYNLDRSIIAVQSGPMQYADTVICLPLDHGDTVYTLKFSMTDTTGWGSDSFSQHIEVYNVPPVLSFKDTVYFEGGFRTPAVAQGETLHVFKRQRTAIAAWSVDTNDNNNVDVRSWLDAVSHAAALGNDSLRDSITGFYDTALYAISVHDPNTFDSISFWVAAYNDPAHDSIGFASYNTTDIEVQARAIAANDTVFILDSAYIRIGAAASDSNESDVRHTLLFNGVPMKSGQGLLFSDTLYADSVNGVDTVRIAVSDSFSSDTVTFFVRVNHAPFVTGLTYVNQGLPLADSARVLVVNGIPDTFDFFARDPDILVDDSLSFTMVIDGVADTTVTLQDSVVRFIRHASMNDTSALCIIHDQSGVADSITVFFLYPSFFFGPSFSGDSLYFADSITLYVTREAATRTGVNVDARSITIINNGTDTLRLFSAWIGAAHWLRLGWSAANSQTGVLYASATGTAARVGPGGSFYLWVKDSAALPVDTLFYDTLRLATNDALHDTIAIPIRIVCGELPSVADNTLHFFGEKPALQKGNKKTDYIPVNSYYKHLGVVFSEFIDRSTVVDSTFMVYSICDSHVAGTLRPIPGFLSWGTRDNLRRDTLFFVPAYTSGGFTSPAFHMRPRDSLFIPADTLRARIKNYITDLAGNPFDANGDHVPDAVGLFRTLSAAVDTGSLVVAHLDPDSGQTGIATDAPITITFSTGLLASSVDTVLVNNKSVHVTSAFSQGVSIPFRAFSASGNGISLVPDILFYSGDTVLVTVSASVRDTFGNSLDGDHNGRGDFAFTDNGSYAAAASFTSHTDDYAYSFMIEEAGFYFYPCPYEPARNARHSAQGGIVFKNLHRLVAHQSDRKLQVRIYDVAGDLVYSSKKANDPIRFFSGIGSNPQWKWNATNTKGRDVGSGIYLFVFTDYAGDDVLKKGKLIVIR